MINENPSFRNPINFTEKIMACLSPSANCFNIEQKYWKFEKHFCSALGI